MNVLLHPSSGLFRLPCGIVWLITLIILSSSTIVNAQEVYLNLDSAYRHDSEQVYEYINKKEWNHVIDKTTEILNFYIDYKPYLYMVDTLVEDMWVYRSHYDSLKIREMLLIQGYAQRKFQRNLIKARDTYIRANSFLRTPEVGDQLSHNIERNLANIYTRLGDYDLAIYYYNICEKYFLTTNNVDALSRLYALYGITFRELNQYQKAYLYHQKGLRLKGEHIRGDLYNYRQLIELFLVQNLLDSVQVYISKYDHEKPSKVYLYDTEVLSLKARYYAKSGQHRKANSVFDKLIIGKKNRHSRSLAKIYNEKANNKMSWGKLAEANRTVQFGLYVLNPKIDSILIALPQKNDIYNENTFSELLNTRSKIYQKLYDLAKNSQYLDSALICFQLVNYNNTNLRNGLTVDRSNLISLAENKEVLGNIIDLLYSRNTTDNSSALNSSFLDTIRHIFDQSKSLLLQKRRSLSANNYDLATRDSINSIKLALSDIHSYAPSDDSIGIARFQQKINLEKKLNYFLNKHSQVRKIESPNDKSYIEFFVSRNYVYALNNMDKKLTFHRIGKRASLEQLVSSFRNNLFLSKSDKNSIDFLNQRSKELFSFLLGKIDQLPSSFTVIPDDMIHLVNFDILINHKNDYLIQDHEIKYAYHSSQWEDNKRDVSFKEHDLLAMIPDYGDEIIAQSDIIRGGLYPLNYALEEVGEIIDCRNNTQDSIIKTGNRNIHKMNRKFDIFHFAGHAIANETSSFLALSDDSMDIIGIQEIEQMPLDYNLVFLSACETGLGSYRAGEGVYSIGRSFYSAGVDHIVQSQWALNDITTSEVASAFYKNLSKGYTVNSSLRKSKLDFLRSATPEHKHPYYWAGLVAFSNHEQMRNQQHWLLYVLGILLVLFIIIYFKNKKSKQ